SWRMMLRQRSGIATFRIVDNETGDSVVYDLRKRLVPKQIGFASTKPDGIWQMAQIIKKEYSDQGKNVSVFVDSKVAVNRGKRRMFVNPRVDLAKAEWNYFGHNEWILLYDNDGNVIK